MKDVVLVVGGKKTSLLDIALNVKIITPAIRLGNNKYMKNKCEEYIIEKGGRKEHFGYSIQRKRGDRIWIAQDIFELKNCKRIIDAIIKS